MNRAEIDPNVRVAGNRTVTGLEDFDHEPYLGQIVKVYESESGISGFGRVSALYPATRLVYIEVDWRSLS